MTRYQVSFRASCLSDYVGEYTAAADEAYTIYKTSGRLITEGYYEDVAEYFI